LNGSSKLYQLLCQKALPLFLLLAFINCSDRPRSNPLDPQNPDYDRDIIGFNAIAGNRQVILYWNRLDFIDLAGIRVLRSSEVNPDTAVLNDSLLSPQVTNLVDTRVSNGETYTYRLQFVLKDDPELPTSRPDKATPGRVFGWMAINDYEEVALMTPDFRDKLYKLEASFYSVEDIKVNPASGEIWVLDSGDGVISHFRPDGEHLRDLTNLGRVAAFSFNTIDFTVWIATEKGLLHHFKPSGELKGSFNLRLTPTSIAIDHLGDRVWIGSLEEKLALIINDNVVHVSYLEFVKPEKVAIGKLSRDVWVLDTGSRGLYHLSGKDGDLEWKLRIFNDPVDLAVNTDGSLCWVADQGADLVYEIDAQGNVTAQVGGLGTPRHLSYEATNRSLYVTGASGLISNLRPGGEINWQVENPDRPGQITLHPLRTHGLIQ